ncbi:MAG TPA: DNA adenine methylase [Patescibacteria group bacterium]|nr:DNA adenine methylase [Patescibacteria group bacterium]
MKDLNQLALKLKTKIDAQPFIKWAGGKRQLLDELEKHKPKWFNRYFEPFVGGGALYFRIQPGQSFLSDINPELVNLYLIIQSKVDELISELKKLKVSEKEFYKIRNIDRKPEYREWNNIKKAARFIYLNKTCFNGLYRMNSKGHFNVPYGNQNNPKILDEYNLRQVNKLLQNSDIKCQSYSGIEKNVKKGDFVYFDPPYAPLNKSSFTKYFKDDFDIKMQVDLRDLCDRLDKKGVYFMISNSHTSLIFGLYKNYDIKVVDAIRAINCKGSGRGKVKEVLITNY